MKSVNWLKVSMIARAKMQVYYEKRKERERERERKKRAGSSDSITN